MQIVQHQKLCRQRSELVPCELLPRSILRPVLGLQPALLRFGAGKRRIPSLTGAKD